MPDSPFLKFRQLVQYELENVKYGRVIKPNRWDGDDPHEVLPLIFGTRELFRNFVDERRLEGILLAEEEIGDDELQQRLRNIVRRSDRRNLSQETKLIFTNIRTVNDAMLHAVKEYRRDYRPLFWFEAKKEDDAVSSLSSADRRALVDGYIEEVLRLTGRRVTRTQIWKTAGYSAPTEFQRWQRNDPGTTKAAHEKFVRYLQIEKPDLK
jgi:hypothetical protein